MTTPKREITALEVTQWSKEPESPNLEAVVSAVNGFVSRLPIVSRLAGDEEWTPEICLGAVMLAARLIKRRNSANGVEAITDIGVTYTARYDSDVARLLQLDDQRKPAVG